MDNKIIGLLGAASLVGKPLAPLLLEHNWQVQAYSRKKKDSELEGLNWRLLNSTNRTTLSAKIENIPYWISLAPIGSLPDYFEMLKSHGAKRIVVLSSTSRFTKINASDPNEQMNAQRLATSEEQLKSWAESNQIDWIVLRPTLIYGYGLDKNISEIARFILRFGFFPLLGNATGLRQPIHADDVAASCLTALSSSAMINRAYNISGGETLSYKEMVTRVFAALSRRPVMLAVPLPVFRLAIAFFRLFPRCRQWSTGMAERMNQDLVFDHSDARRDFGFSPRPFRPSKEDLFKINASD